MANAYKILQPRKKSSQLLQYVSQQTKKGTFCVIYGCEAHSLSYANTFFMFYFHPSGGRYMEDGPE